MHSEVLPFNIRSSVYKQLSISNPSPNPGNFEQHIYVVEFFGAKQQILQKLKISFEVTLLID